MCWSTCFHIQPQSISDQRDELRIRGLSLVIIDGIAEEGIDGVHLAAGPVKSRVSAFFNLLKFAIFPER